MKAIVKNQFVIELDAKSLIYKLFTFSDFSIILSCSLLDSMTNVRPSSILYIMLNKKLGKEFVECY